MRSTDFGELDALLIESLQRCRGSSVRGDSDGHAGTLAGSQAVDAVVDDRGRANCFPTSIRASAGHYDYTTADWYRTPVADDREYLSDPYFDEGGADAWIVTLSVPLVSPDGPLGRDDGRPGPRRRGAAVPAGAADARSTRGAAQRPGRGGDEHRPQHPQSRRPGLGRARRVGTDRDGHARDRPRRRETVATAHARLVAAGTGARST